jgi:hypothetical protein
VGRFGARRHDRDKYVNPRSRYRISQLRHDFCERIRFGAACALCRSQQRFAIASGLTRNRMDKESNGVRVMSDWDTSGAPHNEGSAPRFPGAAPGGPLPARQTSTQNGAAPPRCYTLKFLIAILKKAPK